MGSHQSGVVHLSGDNWAPQPSDQALASNKVQFIKADQAGGVWLATNAGVSFFNGEAWKTFHSSDGLGDNRVFTIAIGPDESIWFGMPNGGVSRFHMISTND